MAKKSFIKTIGSKGLLADYNTEGKKLQTELTAGDNVAIANNVISSNQVFVATYGTTTYQEIKDAYDAGKIVIGKNDSFSSRIYSLEYCDETYGAYFVSINMENNRISAVKCGINNIWQATDKFVQNKLTFDTTPTAGSTNPVTSDGIASFNGYKKIFRQGDSTSTESDSSILFYVRWKSDSNSGIYNRQYEINYSNLKTARGGKIRISPSITTPTGGKLNLVSDRYSFNDITFGVIEAPDGDATHPYWFVGYGYGIGGSIEIIQNGGNMTSTDRPVIVPTEQILTSTCNFTKVYAEKAIYYDYTVAPPTTGTFVLKAVNGVIQWVNE